MNLADLATEGLVMAGIVSLLKALGVIGSEPVMELIDTIQSAPPGANISAISAEAKLVAAVKFRNSPRVRELAGWPGGYPSSPAQPMSPSSPELIYPTSPAPGQLAPPVSPAPGGLLGIVGPDGAPSADLLVSDWMVVYGMVGGLLAAGVAEGVRRYQGRQAQAALDLEPSRRRDIEDELKQARLLKEKEERERAEEELRRYVAPRASLPIIEEEKKEKKKKKKRAEDSEEESAEMDERLKREEAKAAAEEQREKEERERAIEAVRRAEEEEEKREAALRAAAQRKAQEAQEERDRRLAQEAKEEAEAERLRRQAGVAAGAPKKPGPEATVYRRDPEPRRADETREEYVIRLTRQREAEAAAARRTQGFRSKGSEPYQVRCPHIAVLGAAPAVKLASGLVAYCADCVDAQGCPRTDACPLAEQLFLQAVRMVSAMADARFGPA